ncbi:MAG: TlpA disulfide reductase family protein [Comamonas sp.]
MGYPRRRALAYAAVAGLAAAGLGGAVLWRTRGGEPDPLAELWTLALPTPDGGTLRLADWRGRPLIVNFWATWCGPCLEEMPLLDQFQASGGGLPVIGLAADRPEAVARFLQKLPVRFPIGVLPAGGLALARRLGNAGGGLPYSLLIAASGEARIQKSGQLHADELQSWRAQV